MKLGTTPGGGCKPGPRSIASAIAVALFCAILNVWAKLQRFYLRRGRDSRPFIYAIPTTEPIFVAAYVDMAGTCMASLWRRGVVADALCVNRNSSCPMRAFAAGEGARKR